MLTVTLLRHAKSSWDDPDLDDHERPLAKRGTKAAPEIAQRLLARNAAPDLILCSTALRARATLSLILAEDPAIAPQICYDDALYMAHPEQLLSLIRGVDDRIGHIMIVGHNPGLHALALALTGGGRRKEVQELAAKFPTAAAARFTFDSDRWCDVKPGTGTLVTIIKPARRRA